MLRKAKITMTFQIRKIQHDNKQTFTQYMKYKTRRVITRSKSVLILSFPDND